MDDQALLARYVADRDVTAFEELTQRYAGLVKGVCVRVLGNSHDAEEVSQECFSAGKSFRLYVTMTWAPARIAAART